MTPTKENAPGQEGRGKHVWQTHKEHGQHIAHMPIPATRRAAILEAFRQGERLTHADALKRGWGWRLAADVFVLREYGWPIVSDLINQGQGRNPIARYWMPAGRRA